MKSPYDTYLSELGKTRAATQSAGTRDLEHQHRPALKTLLEVMLPDVNAINEPGKIEFGAPDFALMKGGYPIGYVETKRLGENLDDIAKGEQLKRYFGYANLVLTNYLEFRFYKHGEQYGDAITLADLGTLTPDENSYTLLETTTRAFLEDAAEPVRRASRLAEIMGENGKRLRANLLRFLKTDSPKNKPILDIYEAFRSQLIHDLDLEKFTDMYAQTLVYGLFVARYHDETEKDFSRAEARELIPHTNPLLRRFFDHIAGADFDDRLKPIVDDLCKVFTNADVRTLMQQIYKQDLWGAEQAAPDPVIHFYEDFLKEYDPVERKKLGAYYTPPAVVHFIVRSVDAILKRDFDLPQGLADTKKISITRTVQGKKVKDTIHQVQVLDPATGTGTFLNETIRLIRRTFTGQEGRFGGYVSEDLLPRIHGFELMMAPYTIAHLKLAATLRESGAKDFKDRVGVYLTNSLEKGIRRADTLFGFGFAQTISEEGDAAARIKNDTPIMVVIGNPPYSGVSSNETEHANGLIEKYKVEPGGSQKLQERKHWLNDDYVKFIALAEDMVEKTGYGIVGMITNNGYLDNPTFRGMRWHLTQTFDEIYVVDLHGNAKKKETAPDGTKDENVFDIMQGVGIILAVKTGKKRNNKPAEVYHADLYGKRHEKFAMLAGGDIKYKKITLDNEYVWFVPKDLRLYEEYQAGFSVTELFTENTTGMVTAIDRLSIFLSKEELAKTTRSILDSADPYTEFKIKDGRKYKKEERLQELREASSTEPTEVSYRPFDTRFMYYTQKSECWINSPRTEMMRNFRVGENVGLEVCRQTISDTWQHVFVTNKIVDDSFVSNKTRERGYVLPLYLFAEDNTRVPNLNHDIVKHIASAIGEKPTPEDTFDYIYAVLHSPNYREKYKEFLKIEFPRAPYPKDKKQFDVLAALGKQLRELHLLETPAVRTPITTYPEDGANKVEQITRKGDSVYINATQYFGNVPEVAWSFNIGGYQPAQKWLKDRVGRTLTSADIEHYQQIIVALTETHRLMGEIGKIV